MRFTVPFSRRILQRLGWAGRRLRPTRALYALSTAPNYAVETQPEHARRSTYKLKQKKREREKIKFSTRPFFFLVRRIHVNCYVQIVSPEGMATYKPDSDGAPLARTRIIIMIVMVVLIIILGVQVGDVFVNCDRRFGRWWTRRLLPSQCVRSE